MERNIANDPLHSLYTLLRTTYFYSGQYRTSTMLGFWILFTIWKSASIVSLRHVSRYIHKSKQLVCNTIRTENKIKQLVPSLVVWLTGSDIVPPNTTEKTKRENYECKGIFLLTIKKSRSFYGNFENVRTIFSCQEPSSKIPC